MPLLGAVAAGPTPPGGPDACWRRVRAARNRRPSGMSSGGCSLASRPRRRSILTTQTGPRASRSQRRTTFSEHNRAPHGPLMRANPPLHAPRHKELPNPFIVPPPLAARTGTADWKKHARGVVALRRRPKRHSPHPELLLLLPRRRFRCRQDRPRPLRALGMATGANE